MRVYLTRLLLHVPRDNRKSRVTLGSRNEQRCYPEEPSSPRWSVATKKKKPLSKPMENAGPVDQATKPPPVCGASCYFTQRVEVRKEIEEDKLDEAGPSLSCRGTSCISFCPSGRMKRADRVEARSRNSVMPVFLFSLFSRTPQKQSWGCAVRH